MRFILVLLLLSGCASQEAYNRGFRDGSMFMLHLEAKEKGLLIDVDPPIKELEALKKIQEDKKNETEWIFD